MEVHENGVSFPWPPFQAALLIFKFFLLKRVFVKEIIKTKYIAFIAESQAL